MEQPDYSTHELWDNELPPPPPQVVPPPEPRRLRRSMDDRVIGGVCGGLASYLAVDSALVRIAFVLFTLLGGSGVLAYVIAWIVIPEAEPGEQRTAVSGAGADVARVVGVLLVVAGGLVLLDRFVPIARHFVWPLALIALGVALLFGRRTR